MGHRVFTVSRATNDAPEGRALLYTLPELPVSCHLLMDCAYGGNETRQLALDLGFIPVVPPHPNRLEPWRLQGGLISTPQADRVRAHRGSDYVSGVNRP